jgi:hypothetical protein
MPFPFLPAGALVAIVVLLGGLTAFGIGMRSIDRAATRATTALRLSILPGVVSGLRQWERRVDRRAATEPAPSSPGGVEIIDLVGRSDER